MLLRYALSVRSGFSLALLALAVCLPPPAAQAQQPADLLLSEYVEGSSFNKAVEIYNGTGQAVDLGGYELFLSFNGGDTVTLLDAAGRPVAAVTYGGEAPGSRSTCRRLRPCGLSSMTSPAGRSRAS